MEIAGIVFIGVLLSYWTTSWIPIFEPEARCSPQERWGITALAGFLFLTFSLKEAPSLQLMLTFGVIQCLLMIGFIDLKTQNIPDQLTALIGVCAIVLIGFSFSWGQVILAVVGAILGGGILLIAAIVTRGAIGGGDIKLAFALGLIFGPGKVLMLLLLSFIIVAVYALVLVLSHKKGLKDFIPLGPGIVAAALGLLIYYSPWSSGLL